MADKTPAAEQGEFRTRVSAELQVCVAKQGDRFTITITGEIDVSNVDHLLAAVELALSSRPCAAILIDLGAVTFMDCAAISALMQITAECEERSSVLVIVNSSDAVRGLVALAGVSHVLPLI